MKSSKIFTFLLFFTLFLNKQIFMMTYSKLLQMKSTVSVSLSLYMKRCNHFTHIHVHITHTFEQSHGWSFKNFTIFNFFFFFFTSNLACLYHSVPLNEGERKSEQMTERGEYFQILLHPKNHDRHKRPQVVAVNRGCGQ